MFKSFKNQLIYIFLYFTLFNTDNLKIQQHQLQKFLLFIRMNNNKNSRRNIIITLTKNKLT